MVKYTRCSVYGCGVRNLQFFHFPRNVQRAEKWRELAGNPKLYSIPLEKLHHKASICKRHFTRDQFTNTKLDRLNLNAFPSLLLPPNEPPVPHSTAELEVPLDPSLLHYVVLPPMDPSVLAPSVQLDAPDEMCLGGGRESPEMDPALASGEPASEVFECGRGTGSDAPAGGSPNDIPVAFEVLTEYGESENGTSPKAPSVEGAAETPTSGHYRYTLCRLCFSTLDVIMTDIFSVDCRCGYVIKDAIEDLLQFKVSKIDEYPQFICISCLTKLTEFREFKEQLLKDKAVFEEALRKLKLTNCEDDGSSQSVADSITPQEVCPGNLVQMTSFGSTGIEITEENLSGMTSEIVECKGDESAEVLEQQQQMELGKEKVNEEYSLLVADTLKEYDNAENFCEAGGGTAADFGDPLVGAELEIRKELNVGVVEMEGHKCRDCGQLFKYHNHLTKHVKEHQRTWPVSCQYCGKRFRNLNDLNNHIIMHSDYKPFECEYCGLRVRLKTTLLKHKKTHSMLKPFLCPVCRNTFRDKMLLRSHMRTHSKIKCYVCEECGKEFHTHSRMIEHYRSHTGEKPFVCGECGIALSTREVLNRHIRVKHVTKKQFRCAHCNKRFALKKYLQNHLKLHIRRMS